ADFDDAARDHLARAGAAARAVAVEIDPEALPEPGERNVEIEIRIGQRRPTGQRAAVLDLLLAPAPRGFLELGIVGEDPAQVVGVGGAVVLDEARRLDDADDVRIELRPIEAVPGNIVERPRAHAVSHRQLEAECLYTNEWNAMKSLPRGAGESFKASAANLGQCLELGLGDALLPFELAQFGQQVLALGAGGAPDVLAQACQIGLARLHF